VLLGSSSVNKRVFESAVVSLLASDARILSLSVLVLTSGAGELLKGAFWTVFTVVANGSITRLSG